MSGVRIPSPPSGVVRALRRFYHSVLIPAGRFRVVKRGGLLFKVTNNNTLDGRIVRRNAFEPRQARFFFESARAFGAEVFLDVGACFGYYSLLAAQSGMFAEIHAVEPMPGNYARLVWHVENNGFVDRVVCHNVGISETESVLNFSGDGPGAAIAADGRPVRCVAMDSLFALRGRRVAIKMDIEDHELSALKGATALLADNDVLLQVEAHSHTVGHINYLCKEGFELFHYIGEEFYFRREGVDRRA